LDGKLISLKGKLTLQLSSETLEHLKTMKHLKTETFEKRINFAWCLTSS